MRAALLVVCAAVACGDNELADGVPLGVAHDLVVVAHQDDDLLFMQPDVIEAMRGGAGVVTVYVTAGNGTKDVDYAETRYEGLRQAYRAAVGGAGDWSCGWIDLVDHTAEHCRLDAANISLVFLAYPDGGKEGEQPASLLHLWEGTIDGADTIARRPSHYARGDLIETVAEVIREVRPQAIRTLEIAATHGGDHSDHMFTGALALLAAGRAESRAELISYRGYDIETEPVNKIDPVFADDFAVLSRYEACATGCAPCGEACTTITDAHVTWLHRRYAVGFRRGAAGQLRADGRCLGAQGAFDDCAIAPVWRLDGDGQLRTGDTCIEVLSTGDWQLGQCIGGVERHFALDDEGHLWSAIPPAPSSDIGVRHLACLAGPRVELCGSDHAPVWEFTPALHTTPRSKIGFAATGRAVRLADLTGDHLADLCAITPNGLFCAPGNGDGTFAAPVRIDLPQEPLIIDPRSLAIGDVDGDHRADACGRDATGTWCAIFGSNFTAGKWASAFGDQDARAGTSASITAIDANADGRADLCGFAAGGVVCTQHGASPSPLVRSTWPEPAAEVYPGDLDGDGLADWCATSDTGPACGVAAESTLTSNGVPWAFALSGALDAGTLDPDITGLADIDGDGRADLCSLEDTRVECARSQGRGFGPRTVLAEIPGATALWLGDLDGDGRADACADTGTTVTCALSR